MNLMGLSEIDRTPSAKDRQLFRRNQESDTARLAWGAANQAALFQREQHLVNRWGADLEIALQIGFSGGAAVDFGIGINKGQILALAFGKGRLGQGVNS